MHRFPLLLSVAAISAACTQPAQRPAPPSTIFAPASAYEFHAAGANPSWLVLVGQQRITLAITSTGSDGRLQMLRTSFAEVTRDHIPAARRWRAGTGTEVIGVEAWPQPCRVGTAVVEDAVRVRLSGRELRGCGGRAIRGRN